MKKFLLIAVLLSAGWIIQSGRMVSEKKPTDSLEVKQLCLKATVNAIKTEMERYEAWIKQRKEKDNAGDLPSLQARMQELENDLSRYQAMKPQEYVLPGESDSSQVVLPGEFIARRFETVAWVDGNAAMNSVLQMNGMTKSGPWYHMAAIAGDDFTQLRPGVRYKMVIYTVYPRYYWSMTSAYICIVSFGKTL
jgi:hypothetical protein